MKKNLDILLGDNPTITHLFYLTLYFQFFLEDNKKITKESFKMLGQINDTSENISDYFVC